MAEPYVDGKFVLIYGDLLFSEDALKRLIQMFETEHPDAAMAVTPVAKPENYGIVELENIEKSSELLRSQLRAKPRQTWQTLAYTYSVQRSSRQFRASSLRVRGEIELTDAISLMIKHKKRVYAIEIPKDEWLDIGQPWDLLQAKHLGIKENGT